MRKADYDLKLQVRRFEIEAEKEVKLRQLEDLLCAQLRHRRLHQQFSTNKALMSVKILPWCQRSERRRLILISVHSKELQLR